jgi:hypothetical protein
MYYWIAILEESKEKPDHISRMTLDEVLALGRQAIADGHQVLEVSGPNGRVWTGQELTDLLARS